MEKPYSQACENNKKPILEIISQYFKEPGKVLEIGSGTGQHAVYFARLLPHLFWQTSDRAENIPGIKMWLEESNLPNMPPPLKLDVDLNDWLTMSVNHVFTANTAHIMAWSSVVSMFVGIAKTLKSNGFFCQYGPFNQDGEYTSESNERFDAYLKARDPNSGIRDLSTLKQLGLDNDLYLLKKYNMPANNMLLIWSANKPSLNINE